MHLASLRGMYSELALIVGGVHSFSFLVKPISSTKPRTTPRRRMIQYDPCDGRDHAARPILCMWRESGQDVSAWAKVNQPRWFKRRMVQ
jgi:hypothetical protein